MTMTYHFEAKPDDLPLGARLLYKEREYVRAFGRERDKDGKVVYYWVVDEAGKRFKAVPKDLKA